MSTRTKKQSQFKAENQAKILASHFIKNREEFSVADIAQWLGIHHAIAARYLSELADGAQIARRNKNSGEIAFSKKAPALLTKAWRLRTDAELGIISERTAPTVRP
jgi:Fic family protein